MNINKKILKPIFAGLIVLLIVLLCTYVYLSNDSKSTNNYINKLRLDSNHLYEKVTSLWPLENEDIELIKQTLKINDSIHLTILDINETVIFSNNPEYTSKPQWLFRSKLWVGVLAINVLLFIFI